MRGFFPGEPPQPVRTTARLPSRRARTAHCYGSSRFLVDHAAERNAHRRLAGGEKSFQLRRRLVRVRFLQEKIAGNVDVRRVPFHRAGDDDRAECKDKRRPRLFPARKGPAELEIKHVRRFFSQAAVAHVAPMPENLRGEPVAEIADRSGGQVCGGDIGKSAGRGKHRKSLNRNIRDAAFARDGSDRRW